MNATDGRAQVNNDVGPVSGKAAAAGKPSPPSQKEKDMINICIYKELTDYASELGDVRWEAHQKRLTVTSHILPGVTRRFVELGGVATRVTFNIVDKRLKFWKQEHEPRVKALLEFETGRGKRNIPRPNYADFLLSPAPESHTPSSPLPPPSPKKRRLKRRPDDERTGGAAAEELDKKDETVAEIEAGLDEAGKLSDHIASSVKAIVAVGIALTDNNLLHKLYEHVVLPMKEAADKAATAASQLDNMMEEEARTLSGICTSLEGHHRRAQQLGDADAAAPDAAAPDTAASDVTAVWKTAKEAVGAAVEELKRKHVAAAAAARARAEELCSTAEELQQQFDDLETLVKSWVAALGGTDEVSKMPVTRHLARRALERMSVAAPQPAQQWAALLVAVQGSRPTKDVMKHLVKVAADLTDNEPDIAGIVRAFKQEMLAYAARNM